MLPAHGAPTASCVVDRLGGLQAGQAHEEYGGLGPELATLAKAWAIRSAAIEVRLVRFAVRYCGATGQSRAWP